MFIEIRYKHLGYKTSEAGPFQTKVLRVSSLCIPQQELSACPDFRLPTKGTVVLDFGGLLIASGNHVEAVSWDE